MSTTIQTEKLSFPWNTEDPFLFCAYHKDNYPSGDTDLGVSYTELDDRNIGQDFQIKDGYRMYHGSKVPGFPYHPHRGFETITINKKGVVDHSDSLGAAGRFMEGDVQWMTAGGGVQHSEMFPLLNKNEANPLEIFQIWLNLPRASKMVPAYFQMLWAESIPNVEQSEGGKSRTQVIAGSYLGHNAPAPNPDSWASKPENDVRVLTITLEPRALWHLDPSSPDNSRNFYFYEGKSISLNGESIPVNTRIKIDASEEVSITNNTEETAELLLLEGRPIKEPVVQYGPFVMNSEAEIRQTMAEYGRTQFGGWPWPQKEQVHGEDKGRFALHADGRLEEK